MIYRQLVNYFMQWHILAPYQLEFIRNYLKEDAVLILQSSFSDLVLSSTKKPNKTVLNGISIHLKPFD